LDNKAPEKIDSNKSNPWNWKNSLLLFLAFVFVAGLPLGGFGYLCGRFSPYSIFFVVMLIFPAFLLFHLFAVPLYIIRLIRNWNRFRRIKRAVIILQNAVVAYFLICIFTSSGFGLPGYIPFTYGFRANIRTTADIPKIRNWLSTIDHNLCTGKDRDISSKDFRTSEWPKDINWPSYVTVFNPHYVFLALDENNTPKIRLTWGGVFAHWGVEIGSEKMKVPPTQERKLEEYTCNGKKESLWRSGEFRLPLAPGAYVWFKIQ
jgi:hypothetical protein